VGDNRRVRLYIDLQAFHLGPLRGRERFGRDVNLAVLRRASLTGETPALAQVVLRKMFLFAGRGLGDLPFKNLHLAPPTRPASPTQVHQVHAELACPFEDGLPGSDFSSPADRFKIDHKTRHRLSLLFHGHVYVPRNVDSIRLVLERKGRESGRADPF